MTAQVVPSKNEMERYLARGLTQAQIAQEHGERTGHKISRSAIAMAIERYGLKSAHPRPRYEELLPWTVREEHSHHWDARMLRLEGRRRAGGSLSDDELRYLTGWLRQLQEQHAVVYYDPETEEGFHWIPREKGHDDIVDRPDQGAA